jgi:hypothetical protein
MRERRDHMTRRTLVLVGGLALGAAIVLPDPGVRAQAPGVPVDRNLRTPWGDPDIQGLFTTDGELGVPFERPEQFGDRVVVTDQEFAERAAQSARQAAVDAEEFVAPTQGGRGGGTGPPAHWLERGIPSRRTSVVIDPPDGRIPYLNDRARERSRNAVNARTTGQLPFDGPTALDLYDRCITRGLPHVIFPTIYNNTSQIVQGPGWVAIRYEMIHDARVIPLDGRAPLPSAMRQYFGDSRGHWEGDTLVVEVTNFPVESINYRGAGAGLRLTERFRRIDANAVRYEVTVDDPETFSAPWTAALGLQSGTGLPDVFEYACHEGNYAMRNILSAARAEEVAAPAAGSK